MSDSQTRALTFKEQLESKIHKIIEEFAVGKISREQFHVIYEKYSAQLEIANHAILSGNPDAVSIAQGGPPTIAIRDAFMGKAMGMLIFHNKSAKVIETLGEISVPMTNIKPVLKDISRMMEENKPIERQVIKSGEKQWLMFVAGTYTSVVTEFMHQPSEMQMRKIERLHHDFEEANCTMLKSEQIDHTMMAYPFLVLIRRKKD